MSDTPYGGIRLGVVGGRYITDREWVWDQIEAYVEKLGGRAKLEQVVSGGCTGVDTAATAWAVDAEIKSVERLPKRRNSTRELLARNTLIAQDCTHLLALPSPHSRGTWDTVRKARKMRKKVRVVMYKG